MIVLSSATSMLCAAATGHAAVGLVAGLSAHTFPIESSPYQIAGGPIPHLARVLIEGGRPDIGQLFLSRRRPDFAQAQRRLHTLLEQSGDTALIHAVSQILVAYERKARERVQSSSSLHRVPTQFSFGAYLRFLQSSPPLTANELFHAGDEVLLSPTFSEEAIYHLFSGAVFTEIGSGWQAVVYSCGGYVIKEPFSHIVMTEQDRQAIHRLPVLGKTLRALNRIAGDIPLWHWAKRNLRLAINFFRPQQITGTETVLEGYRIGLERLEGLVTPYRILDGTRFHLRAKRSNPKALRSARKVIFQKKVEKLVIDKLKEFLKTGAKNEVRQLLRDAIMFQIALWRRGAADIDDGINVFENLEVNPDGTVRLVDAGAVSADRILARQFVERSATHALEIQHGLESGHSLSDVVVAFTKLGYSRDRAISYLLENLRRHFTVEDFEMIGREFIRSILRIFRVDNFDTQFG